VLSFPLPRALRVVLLAAYGLLGNRWSDVPIRVEHTDRALRLELVLPLPLVVPAAVMPQKPRHVMQSHVHTREIAAIRASNSPATVGK
jgi:hypothetical protein